MRTVKGWHRHILANELLQLRISESIPAYDQRLECQ